MITVNDNPAPVAGPATAIKTFAELAALLPVGVLQTDAEGRCVHANAKWMEMSGLRPGASLDEILAPFAPEEREALLAERRAAIAARREWHYDLRGSAPPPGPTWVRVRVHPVFNDAGQFTGSVCTAEDISMQRQLEDRLRLKSAALDAAANAVAITDRTGAIEWINPAFSRLTGYSTEEVLGQNPRVLKSGVHSKSFYADLWRTIGAGKVWRGEVVNRRKDGATYTEEMTIAPVRDAAGATAHFIAVKQDISVRKAAEQALRESETYARSILDSAYDAFVEVNAEAIVRAWNPRAVEMFGWGRTDALGRCLCDMIAPARLRENYKKGLCRHLLATDGSAERVRMEITVMHRDGREFPAEVVLWPVRRGDTWRFNLFIHDITERRQAAAALVQARDAALESARMKSEFLANMSHEIRTPMNGVLGMLTLLDDRELKPEQREFAATARASAEALLALLNDILDFSKIEAGKLALEATDFDLRDMVEGTLELLAERAQTKGVELIGEIVPGTPTALHGDGSRLRQVLLNLVGNAIKFTDRGEVAVTVSADRSEEGTPTLRVAVRDTGIGIAPEVMPKLFQSFTQADGTTTRKYGGTGLGLAICRRIVELMGGAISAQSEPGRGSVFSFHVPVGRSEGSLPLAPRVSVAGRRVLAVDDNATNRLVLRHQLTAWGMRYTEAAEAGEALRLLRDAAARGEPFAVALLDFQMPGTDGLALARAIKEDPAIATTRLVVLTSLGMRLDEKTRRAAGLDECLLKPVRQARLHDCVARCLGQAATTGPVPVVTAPPPKLSGLRVLLAEDNAVNQKVALGQLRRLGYTADVVSDGRDAVDAHARQPYDVILMDCQMPEMEGYDASQLIRAQERSANDHAGRHVYMIALTAHALPGDRARCLAAGMDDYVTKPVTLDALREALDRAQTAQPDPALAKP
jgi:PAS domain S-box-containing protein